MRLERRIRQSLASVCLSGEDLLPERNVANRSPMGDGDARRTCSAIVLQGSDGSLSDSTEFGYLPAFTPGITAEPHYELKRENK